jgi:glycolate oxidase FAD binding subunit
MSADDALARVRRWARQAYPISATCYFDGLLRLRLSGAAASVESAAKTLSREGLSAEANNDDSWWRSLRDHTHAHFERSNAPEEGSLWRLSVPPASPMPQGSGEDPWLIEWAAGQRWWRTSRTPTQVLEVAAQMGGSARRYSGGPPVATQPGKAQRAIEARLKLAFDPRGVFSMRAGNADEAA